MLKDDIFTYSIIWVFIEVIYMITPTCIAISILRLVPVNQFRVPKFLEYLALVETLFYFLFYLPRRHARDKSDPYFTDRTRNERRDLFYKCCETIPDLEQWFSIWFKEVDAGTLRREDVKDFLAWGFLNKTSVYEEDRDELEEYLAVIENRIGRRFLPGSRSLEPCKVSTDPLRLHHRSLLYYASTVSIADTACYILMARMSFQHHRLPISATHSVYPLRPLTLLFSQQISPSPKLSYWYRAHTSQKRRPILFLHGIGGGLQIYATFLQSLISKLNSECDDGQVGILALEIMPISFRLTDTLPHREDLVDQIRTILDFHSWKDFVVVAHSFGSIFATHLIRSLRLTDPVHMHPLVLVDAVTLSIHFAEIPYNFIYRKPRTASELLCSFAATDIGVAHCITRMFDWTQNVLWLDELEGRSVSVVLAGKDSIIDAEKLRRYLAKFGFGGKSNGIVACEGNTGDMEGNGDEKEKGYDRIHEHGTHVEVVFYEAYNHGEIFLRSQGRKDLADIVFRHCQRCQ